ncbi:hypothetical protein AJ85_15815 [Alkalihalobacillus alcalophilus ATCC 27647 = CGMCC 1.3604]|uniref:Uncharacterized protein n=1 Tax=Alkalihalobacillus alcalophilus ATCC 27647 = CGMCC 1.3604 TaxID=1218173 RepID=A0A094WSG8_ALKAL|nr:hypothetical protein [Alkalihalobacillus alcalophilus]KGA99018.1 hypothetical protein BALCAV_0200875 [Alkalihalobacillus alcalophilus ATCC 27647 = CGMCC 1.3604]MED1560659.1 hypothetical protein [Alkalihalobacillus alcalophilus]THG89677.1 hypothetical protein AJ85_15815 [Alkalihalobacillus alcalophilus ATCC 27647 = CGMCC 1.3604]
MKVGIRKPSLKRRISARTSVKHFVVHRPGVRTPKTYGWITSPKNSSHKVYQRTTFFNAFKKIFK